MTTNYRCHGNRCPERTNCARYSQDRIQLGEDYAAFDSRREAGATACDGFKPIYPPKSTFAARFKSFFHLGEDNGQPD
jgi:hypothetical protein